MADVNNAVDDQIANRIMKALAFMLAKTRRLRIDDNDRLARAQGPLILVSNHASRLDSVFYHYATSARLTVCGARPVYFNNIWRRAVMKLMNVKKAENRKQFVTECCELLAANQVLLLYPEMKTNREGLGTFKNWAAEVAIRSGAPIMPCYIGGTSRHKKRPATISVGPGIDPRTYADEDSLTSILREHIMHLSKERAL